MGIAALHPSYSADLELKNLRASGIDVTNFTKLIDRANSSEIEQAVGTIKEHHPNEYIWVEYA